MRFMSLLAFAVGIGIALAVASSYGREARARIDQAEALASEQETRTFCQGSGFASGSDAYARCADGLNEIKRRHRERWEADAAGIL